MIRRDDNKKGGFSFSKIVTFCFACTIGLFCLKYLIFDFSWREIIKIFNHVDFSLLIAASVAPIILWIIRSFRWAILLKNRGENATFINIYLCNAVAQALSMVTPLNGGELIKIVLLKKFGLKSSRTGLGTFAFERFTDLATLILLGIFSFFILNRSLFTHHHFTQTLFISGIVFILFSIVFYFIINGNYLWLQKIILLLKQISGPPQALVLILLCSLISWVIIALGWYFSLLSINIHISFFNIIILMFVVTIAGIISFIPASLGIAEWSTAMVLLLMGQTEALAQAGAIVLRLYGIIAIIIGLLHLPLLSICNFFQCKLHCKKHNTAKNFLSEARKGSVI